MTESADWWRQAAVYQIYPRSFKDSNGDGVGDIQGIISKVGYLRSLHIDAVWLSPFYKSALVDGGYDVDDYRSVDPRLGTLEDFDALVRELHNANIKIFIDIVPNHSSNLHSWFQEALESEPGSAARNRYIFRNGRGAHGELPPTNWPSHFAPSAWTHESAWGGKHNQWYCHLFAPEQPDFNWDNREVEEEFLGILKFWADKGVDGFRIDVAHALKKDLSEPLRDLSRFPSLDEQSDGNGVLFDRTEVHAVYREWRKLFNQYDPPRVAVAEAYVSEKSMIRYASKEELGQAFNFGLFDAAFDARDYRDLIDKSFSAAKSFGSSTTWALNNHDQMRVATKYGILPTVDRIRWKATLGTSHPIDIELGKQSALAAAMLIMALPGSIYMYQGEELALQEVLDIPEDQIQDPQYLRNHKVDRGRDGCRVPLPWTRTGTSYGFGSGGSHLPQPKWFAEVSVEAQDGLSSSPLEIYRRALALRHTLQAEEEMEWIETNNKRVLHFRRPNGWHCITNFGNSYFDFIDDLPKGSEILHSSQPLAPAGIYIVHGIETGANALPPATTVWVKAPTA